MRAGRSCGCVERDGFFVITNKIYNFVICCARILHQNGVELNFLFKGIISFTMRPRASPSGGGRGG